MQLLLSSLGLGAKPLTASALAEPPDSGVADLLPTLTAEGASLLVLRASEDEEEEDDDVAAAVAAAVTAAATAAAADDDDEGDD